MADVTRARKPADKPQRAQIDRRDDLFTTKPADGQERPAVDGSDDECHTSRLPIELLEQILLRTFLCLFLGHYKRTTTQACQLTYTTLAGVAFAWRQTIIGWPQSDTGRWFRNQLRRQLYEAFRPYRRRPELLAGMPIEGKECAVAHLNEQIYVAWRWFDTIKIFSDVPPYGWLKDIHVPGMDPRCIAACHQSHQLYVVDWRHFGIWRLNKTGGASWFELDLSSPRSISVASGRPLVTSDKDLVLFAPDGAKLKQVPLPASVDPQHSVETRGGTYVVGHTGRGDENLHSEQISEFDDEGNMIRCYGYGRGSGPEQLNWPYHVTLDPEGRVIVADFGNRRVLMLNAELQLDRVLVEDKKGEELGKPWRLCYVHRTGQLMVCEWLRGIKVYRVR